MLQGNACNVEFRELCCALEMLPERGAGRVEFWEHDVVRARVEVRLGIGSGHSP